MLQTLLSDSFSLHSENYVKIADCCHVSLTFNSLIYKIKTSDNRYKKIELPIKNVTSCKPCDYPNPSDDKKRIAFFKIVLYSLKRTGNFIYTNEDYFRVVTVFGYLNSSNYQNNLNVVEKWCQTLLAIKYCDISCNQIRDIEEIPKASIKRLLLIVNPASGSKRSIDVFQRKVLPILIESCLKFDTLYTKKRNDALNYIQKSNDLRKWHGFVVVSGDGLLFEVFNGLMKRRDACNNICNYPVGIIPAGSGNGLASAIRYSNRELNKCDSVISATLNVVNGVSSAMDLVKVTFKEKIYYSFLSVGYGLISDIDIESERLRIVGGARFTLWAVIRAISLRRYEARLSFLPVEGWKQENLMENGNKFEESDRKNNLPRSISLDERTYRRKNQTRCNSLKNFSQDNFYNNENSWRDHFIDGNIDDINERLNLPEICDEIPENWVQIEGSFVLIHSSKQTHLSDDCFFVPYAKMDDGLIWLVYITGEVTRLQVLQFLTCLENGTHINLPFVHMIPVHAFRLEPLSTTGNITIDGELMDLEVFQASVEPKVARLMTSH